MTRQRVEEAGRLLVIDLPPEEGDNDRGGHRGEVVDGSEKDLAKGDLV